MKVIALNGSSRGDRGVTARLLKAFTEGLSHAGSRVRSINLNGLSISPCKSCFSCMHTRNGVCIIDDDMKEIYHELQSSEIFIIGTPLYTDTMSSQMKAVFDRCICAMQPFICEDEHGRFRHKYFWKMPPRFILVSTSGFPERENFESLSCTVRTQAYNFGSELIGEMLIPGSIALQMNLTLLEPHLELLREAGTELGKNGSIPADLLQRINTPILAKEEYLELYKKYEQWCIKKLSSKNRE